MRRSPSRDRLDGTEKKSKFKEIYLAPGRLILWFNYMFPAKGMQNITKSARHAKSPIMTFLYATMFWIFFFSGCMLGLIELINPTVV